MKQLKIDAKEKADQIKRFRQALTKYGIIPFLMALKRLENEERYELCQIALDTIKRANLYLKEPLPTKLDQKIFKQVREQFQLLMPIKNTCRPHFDVYADEIYDEIMQPGGITLCGNDFIFFGLA